MSDKQNATMTKSGADPAVALLEDLSDAVATSFDTLKADDKATEIRLTRAERKLDDLEMRGWRSAVGVDKERTETLRLSFGCFVAGLAQSVHTRTDPASNPLVQRSYQLIGVERALALQEDTLSEGGYLIPRPLFDEILRLAGVVGIARRLGRIIPMTSKTLDIPNTAIEPSVGIVAEEGAIAFSEPTFQAVVLTAKKIASLARLSLELDQDSIVQLGEFLLQLFLEKILGVEDAQALEGTGTGVNFSGVFTVAGTGAVAVSGALTVALTDKFHDALALLPLSARNDDSCAWVMHPKVWRDLNKLKVAQYSTDTGGSPWINPSPPVATPLSLLGKPVYLSDQILSNRGAGTNESTCYIGAWRRGLIIGERMTPALALNPYSDFATAQIQLRVLERVAIVVAIPAAFVKLTGIIVA